MPSLIDLRRRIRSVKNTQQITKAMKMVSAAKLRRAQQQVLAARPYATLLREILGSVLGAVADRGDFEHPLLAKRRENRALLVVLSSDKGLCGAFNSQIFREAKLFLDGAEASEISLLPIGKKGRDYFARRKRPFLDQRVNFTSRIEFDDAREIAAKIIDAFSDAAVDAVHLLYGEFGGALAQKPVLRRLLPVEPPRGDDAVPAEYIYEQPPENLFEKLLPRYVEVQIYQAMLESAASEHAARMAAMDSATRNAGDMIDTLTLRLNRVRQAGITTEIIEVVGGAAALQ